MADIVLNGVSIEELKKQKALIQRDASAFIANGIAEATELVRAIIYCDGDEDIDVEATARAAREILDNVSLVSRVSDVAYFLPYNEPYDGGNALSDELEDLTDEDGNELDVYGDSELAVLYDTLQSMEHNSFLWNSSSIGC